MSVLLWSAETRSKPMESVYETEQPEQAVADTQEQEYEISDFPVKAIGDFLYSRLFESDEQAPETIAETVATVQDSEPVDIMESEGLDIAELFVLSVIVGILLVRTLLEKFFV